jgi:hypothetical protein
LLLTSLDRLLRLFYKATHPFEYQTSLPIGAILV